jgi:uncharacterized protein
MEELYTRVKELFEAYQPLGHDIKHAFRTALMARQIALAESYDPDEAEAAGLLHDIGRTVKDAANPHAHEGAPLARQYLDKYTSFSDDAKERIAHTIYVHSDVTTDDSLSHILQDADKLDGMGAIGIARAYMTHYYKTDYIAGNVIPDPGNYYGNTKSAHEQIVLQMVWFDMLYTEYAKKIGKPRQEFMQNFMEEFKREVGEAI